MGTNGDEGRPGRRVLRRPRSGCNACQRPGPRRARLAPSGPARAQLVHRRAPPRGTPRRPLLPRHAAPRRRRRSSRAQSRSCSSATRASRRTSSSATSSSTPSSCSGFGKQAQGVGADPARTDAHEDAAAPTPGSSQPNSTGLGSLELARGQDHLTRDGVMLTGERDIFGKPWNAAAMAAAQAAGSSWSGGTWNGSSWSGSSWSGSSWSGSSWSGSSWSGSSWSAAPGPAAPGRAAPGAAAPGRAAPGRAARGRAAPGRGSSWSSAVVGLRRCACSARAPTGRSASARSDSSSPALAAAIYVLGRSPASARQRRLQRPVVDARARLPRRRGERRPSPLSQRGAQPLAERGGARLRALLRLAARPDRGAARRRRRSHCWRSGGSGR